ncbi:hypothetical protein RRG08_015718 [Elysia crispata]|uniref:Uncharacterized protein n=1 Tax=Elysia crispata TaxID=231223 RepID=A0AAE1DA73_9GAST|nr:hypothetical protein RRG08_015718 [Elysia crispata]
MRPSTTPIIIMYVYVSHQRRISSRSLRRSVEIRPRSRINVSDTHSSIHQPDRQAGSVKTCPSEEPLFQITDKSLATATSGRARCASSLTRPWQREEINLPVYLASVDASEPPEISYQRTNSDIITKIHASNLRGRVYILLRTPYDIPTRPDGGLTFSWLQKLQGHTAVSMFKLLFLAPGSSQQVTARPRFMTPACRVSKPQVRSSYKPTKRINYAVPLKIADEISRGLTPGPLDSSQNSRLKMFVCAAARQRLVHVTLRGGNDQMV